MSLRELCAQMLLGQRKSVADTSNHAICDVEVPWIGRVEMSTAVTRHRQRSSAKRKPLLE
jgi:hypothetical protein